MFFLEPAKLQHKHTKSFKQNIKRGAAKKTAPSISYLDLVRTVSYLKDERVGPVIGVMSGENCGQRPLVALQIGDELNDMKANNVENQVDFIDDEHFRFYANFGDSSEIMLSIWVDKKQCPNGWLEIFLQEEYLMVPKGPEIFRNEYGNNSTLLATMEVNEWAEYIDIFGNITIDLAWEDWVTEFQLLQDTNFIISIRLKATSTLEATAETLIERRTYDFNTLWTSLLATSSAILSIFSFLFPNTLPNRYPRWKYESTEEKHFIRNDMENDIYIDE